ncbi:1,4-dihydroxy-2-naphthoate octaprenyltransferase [uncultured Planktosalinus sp.]|uniref:1,4-dihydroxy-2-naphthoate octaprenyltransferase n=1 Tax=uncultured Planktosalinus sp. TaxID=1810935 RepID=UPI0030D78EA7
MATFKSWVQAARLRTLPLSFSGIIVGTAMALDAGKFDVIIFILALLTTLGFQVLSNFANDYGDGIKGTDNADRVGPKRALQSGLLTETELKNGMILTALLTLFVAVILIYVAFGTENLGYFVLFLLLGIASIAAAIKYTVGQSAYGYKAMGDLFVLLFFGLLSVAGSFFLYTQSLTPLVFLPAFTIGLLSTAVLNLNNMRDLISDKNVNKITVPVLLGAEKAKRYHAFLLSGAYATAFLYFYFSNALWWQYAPLLALIPLLGHFARVKMNKTPSLLDPELKKVALTTFFFSVLFFLVLLF